MTTYKTLTTALAVAISSPALAGAYVSTPSPLATDQVRYFKGEATVIRKTPRGTISIIPLGNDNGRPAFAIDVDYEGAEAINFGLADISVECEGKPVPVLTKKQLAEKAANAAAWASFGAAMAASLANTNYGSSTTSGHIGRTNFHSTTTAVYTDQAGARADAREANRAIKASLEDRLSDAANNVIDLTTIDPGGSYGGKIVLDKPKAKKWPAPVVVTVLGEAFAFTMSK